MLQYVFQLTSKPRRNRSCSGSIDLLHAVMDGVRYTRRAGAHRHADRQRRCPDLIRDVGYEPVLIGGLEEGKYLMPGTELAGERSAEEIRKIAAKLN